jgi:aminoglycoside phosphotransferase (APT) family kinase protein
MADEVCVQLARLETLDGYRELFSDASFWEPYVRAVCARHGLAPCTDVHAPRPGTCPTFNVDQRWVVTFFGRRFNGGRSWAAECAAARLLAGNSAIPTAALLAEGRLCEPTGQGWTWPYLIFQYAPGPNFGDVYERFSQEDRLALARELAHITRRLHALPLPRDPGPLVPALQGEPADEPPYVEFLREQRAGCVARQRAWGSLPPRLRTQLEDFLPPVEDLIAPTAQLHLIHADLTGDHVLGRLEADRWHTLAIIDFGDASIGDLYYELVALHLDLFRSDKEMLRAYLDACGLPDAQRRGFAARALAYTLLHQFDVLTGVIGRNPELRQVGSLSEMAERSWDVDRADR